jgi:hypothetical protein
MRTKNKNKLQTKGALKVKLEKFNDIGFSIRTGVLFDVQRRRKSKKHAVYYDNIIGASKNFIIEVRRLENTIIHQRVFESILELGKEKANGNLLIDNLYQLKKLSGINTDTSNQVIVDIIEDIKTIHIKISSVNGSTQSEPINFGLIKKIVKITENEIKNVKSMEIILDPDFMSLINSLTKIKFDKELMEYIHTKVKSAYCEKLIKYFLTQQKPSKWDIWDLLQLIIDFAMSNIDNVKLDLNKINDRKKRRILEEIQKESKLLEEFGIIFNRKSQKIEFNPSLNQHKNKVLINYSTL